MKTAISNVAPGQVVKFHGEPCIVLEHRTAGTLLVTAAQIKSSFGSTNNFAVSSFREHLNGAFADALTEGHADELITREVDLTALNGSKEYGSCECKVAPLTFDEIRRFHGLLPKPESWEWSATPWSTPAWMRMIPGSWACTPMAMSAATAAPAPAGPAPLSSSPPSMPWRLTAAWTSTPPMS